MLPLQIDSSAFGPTSPEAKLDSLEHYATDDSGAAFAEVPEHKIELCECMLDMAAAVFNVSSRELRGTGRSSLDVSRVRQIAMYVSHVIFGLSMAEIGVGFGRDRTTVLHACHVVEDLRDDAEFESVVSVFERIASAAFRFRCNAGE